jgi:hypothetical protein
MRKVPLAWMAALAVGLSATARAAEDKKAPGEGSYGRKGTLELGGSVDFNWDQNLFTLGLTPTVGYFVAERIEVTALFSLEYENLSVAGSRTGRTVGSLLIEPSYHIPVETEARGIWAFGGIGLGGEWDGGSVNFDVAPRVGLNIGLGKSAVFTPAISVPITFGNETLVGLKIEAGITTTF